MWSLSMCYSYIKGEDNVVTSSVLPIYKRGKTMLSLPMCFSYIKGGDDVVTSNVLLIYKRGRRCGHFQCASHI